MLLQRLLLLWVLLVLGASSVVAQQQTTRILFLLDGSGSMRAKMGDSYRIDVAKEKLSEIVDSLSNEPNLQMALRVYGHQYDKRYQNCTDTKLEAPFRARNVPIIKRKLREIVPKGTTPIAYSLKQTANDFPQGSNSRNIVIIITDGLESCDGDPCEVSQALQSRNIFLRPFVIGLNGDKSFARQFDCLGTYIQASTPSAFKNAVSSAVQTATGETKVSVDLLDSHGRATETNVNVSFVNSVTGRAEYDFIHHIPEDGSRDPLEVDAMKSYHLVVHTTPRVVKRNIRLQGGKHNVIKVKCPQGKLTIKHGRRSAYRELKVLVRKGQRILNEQNQNQTIRYLAGTYDVEIMTIPKTIHRGVSIQNNRTTELAVPNPGVLRIGQIMDGYGGIFALTDRGEELVVPLEGNCQINTPLQPGKYKVVFRASKSKTANHTVVKKFIIEPGKTQNITLF